MPTKFVTNPRPAAKKPAVRKNNRPLGFGETPEWVVTLYGANGAKIRERRARLHSTLSTAEEVLGDEELPGMGLQRLVASMSAAYKEPSMTVPTLSGGKVVVRTAIRGNPRRAPMRRNYAGAATTNYLRGLRPGQVERLVREGSLDITHSDIGNDYYTVTLFEQGQGENYRQVEAKWFVKGDDAWYDLSLGLRNGKVDPATADLFLGPSRWDKREREEQTRAAAKRKGIDIDASRHYFNNPRRKNPRDIAVTATIEQDDLSGGWSVYLHRGRRIVNVTGDVFASEAAAKREAKALLALARAGVSLDTLVSMFWKAHHAPFRRAEHELANPRRPAAKKPRAAKRTSKRTAAQNNAARAMKMFHSGKASSLAEAWAMIRAGR